MKRKLAASVIILMAILVSGCASTDSKKTEMKPAKSAMTESKMAANNGPALIESEENYYVWEYEGRIWVIGNQSTSENFAKNHHMPYTKTVLGAGPNGETVIFEVDKKKPEMADQLKSKYESTPFLLESDESGYHLWKYKERLYVTGNPETNENFRHHPHLPYTKTILGLGPFGETVIFEVDKKDTEFVDGLVAKYESTPFLIRSEEDDFHVWIYKGRIYVIGHKKTHENFKKHPHLPYTKTVLGAGPNGETVIFEVDKKDEAFADNLRTRYERG